MNGIKQELYEFGGFRLDVNERVLVRSGDGERVALPDKAFDTLCVLVRNAGQLVPKNELLGQVWADAYVEENNLNKAVHAVRRALGDNNGEPKFVETVKRHGFRFVAEVHRSGNGNGTGNGHRNGNELNGSTASANGNLAAVPPLPVGAAAPATLAQEDDGIFSRPLLVALAVILCAAVGIGAYSWFAPVAPATKQFSILVLPVQPIDAGAGEDVLKLGIADAMIQRLSGSPDVVVRALREIRQYGAADQDPISAGRQQKVDYVLASNYQTADGKIRVTGQLINVATGRVEDTLKSEIDLANKFAMQDALAADFGGRILKRLGASPGKRTPRRGTANEDAYMAYLQGMNLLDKADGPSVPQAIAAFDKAIELDPNYAAAWAAKGHAHCANSHLNSSPPDLEYKTAEPAVRHALELDPDNAEAYVVLGMITSEYFWDFEKGEAYFRRALEIEPSLDFGHRWYGYRLVRAGRVDEGLAHLRESIHLNPAALGFQMTYGLALFEGGRLDEAEAQMQRVKEMAPESDFADGILWQVYHRKGDGVRAYASLRNFLGMKPHRAEFIGPFEAAYKQGGWAAALAAYQKQLVAKVPAGYWPWHYFVAVVSAYVGDREQALKSLDEAIKYRLYDVPFMTTDPRLATIRSDPRFADLVTRSAIK